MKKLYIVLAMLLSGLAASAQVYTHYFENKDAFKSFPALKQMEANKLVLKKMPQVNVKKLLEEDKELEGLELLYSLKIQSILNI
ncbi:hypothetical protein FACS1894181_07980 [Bacteroidia bacterium]|nr:hypothetical protein FACS1894181_07980 [Bacteroidia bacterium]